MTADFAFMAERPPLAADFKTVPEDFVVEENLGYEPTGSGEHLCLYLEKCNLSTPQVARHLARTCAVNPRDVSYAGLKDRQSIARQWFSLHLGLNREIDPAGIETEQLKILAIERNSRKIRIGTHCGNRFRIRLRRLRGDRQGLFERLERIRRDGVPNYFGAQRFGLAGANVRLAGDMFKGRIRVKDRFLRGMYMSAARSWLFNSLLSRRVSQGNWNCHVPGDVMALQGSGSVFVPDDWDPLLQQRLDSFDIHPSGPLWGRGSSLATATAAELEAAVTGMWPDLCAGLEAAGLQQERRSLRLQVADLRLEYPVQDDMVLEFTLGKGAYATSVLRELVDIEGGSD
ncbi:MAG: tRNA pseudouridine(13) synthase TruD [Pseudomonadales bacterium]|nr:tRNA pseudouridine(13) synthase TruD [Pseudomonadales bacterium]